MLYYGLRRSLDNGSHRNTTTNTLIKQSQQTANLIALLELLTVLLKYIVGLCFHREIFSKEERLCLLLLALYLILSSVYYSCIIG